VHRAERIFTEGNPPSIGDAAHRRRCAATVPARRAKRTLMPLVARSALPLLRMSTERGKGLDAVPPMAAILVMGAKEVDRARW
jgi:hypothetical protein